MDKAKLDRYFKPVKRERINWAVSPYICVCGKEYKRLNNYRKHRRKFNCKKEATHWEVPLWGD